MGIAQIPKEDWKNRYVSVAALSVAFSLTTSAAFAGEVAELVVGTWELVSLDLHHERGAQAIFGPQPRGLQIMTPDGRFSVLTLRSELSPYASGNRIQGTDEEYRAIGQGSNAAYGRYTIDEAAQTITFHVDASTFPNWEGQDQVRVFEVDGDEWRYVNPSPTVGDGKVHAIWRRLD